MMRETLAGVLAGLRHTAAVAVALCALNGAAAAQQQGPDTLAETYAAWAVRCQTAQDGPRRCTMTQLLQREPGGDRLLLVEIALGENKQPMLAMLTPFGLNVSQGAGLQTDEETPRTVPFFTCLPTGCIVRQPLAEADLAALRRGSTLTASFTVAQGGEPFAMKLSLEGFSAAYRRLTELAD